jgi:flagellar basal body-associated protein FliL
VNTNLLAQCEKTIDKCITDALSAYNSPLKEAVNSALTVHRDALHKLASESVSELVNSDEFKQSMKTEMKRKLAKVLISQYGGEIEKTVGQLKADPTSRAKMTLAIYTVMEDILK